MDMDLRNVSSAAKARRFLDDPMGYFGHSHTDAHGGPRAELEELQAAALAIRFDEQRERIPTLRKLADGQNIRSLSEIEEVLPICFEHTAYKSYPSRFLETMDFVQLTRWLNKVTSVDLSDVDASHCGTIDEWLDLLVDETDLDPITSSGSTGTMSFVPRRKRDWALQFQGLRTAYFQKFGEPLDPEQLNEKIHCINLTFADGHTGVFRNAAYLKKFFCADDESYFHSLYDSKGSSDMMYLAARLRHAEARGDRSRVEVPRNLLARRAELAALQEDMAKRRVSFVEEIVAALAGKRIYGAATWNLWHDVAKSGLANGVACQVAPNSVLMSGGGAKGLAPPPDWERKVLEFFGVPALKMGYGMTEQTHMDPLCDQGRYHVQPWAIPFLIDPDSGKSLPRKNTQTGRMVFFDLGVTGHWGGIITGDEVEIEFSELCPCGRTSIHIGPAIQRYSEMRGGTDKITCAATPEAHAEAMDFLSSFDL